MIALAVIGAITLYLAACAVIIVAGTVLVPLGAAWLVRRIARRDDIEALADATREERPRDWDTRELTR